MFEEFIAGGTERIKDAWHRRRAQYQQKEIAFHGGKNFFSHGLIVGVNNIFNDFGSNGETSFLIDGALLPSDIPFWPKTAVIF